MDGANDNKVPFSKMRAGTPQHARFVFRFYIVLFVGSVSSLIFMQWLWPNVGPPHRVLWAIFLAAFLKGALVPVAVVTFSALAIIAGLLKSFLSRILLP